MELPDDIRAFGFRARRIHRDPDDAPARCPDAECDVLRRAMPRHVTVAKSSTGYLIEVSATLAIEKAPDEPVGAFTERIRTGMANALAVVQAALAQGSEADASWKVATIGDVGTIDAYAVGRLHDKGIEVFLVLDEDEGCGTG